DNMPTPPQPPTMIWRDGEPLFGGRPRLGMSIQDTEDGKGAKVLDVDGDSNASKAGIQKNDIITEIDGTAVNSADEVARIMRQKSTATSVRLQVLRNGKTQTIEIKTPRKLKTVDL
ncbi:MAG: PDZ domain-containing protein, partial [Candidatus Dadabacteria bacterium]